MVAKMNIKEVARTSLLYRIAYLITNMNYWKHKQHLDMSLFFWIVIVLFNNKKRGRVVAQVPVGNLLLC